MQSLIVVLALSCNVALSFKTIGMKSRTALIKSAVDDKSEVTEYFNNVGFSRWNKIYSVDGEVNKVQLDIRTGHQITIDKVINWMSEEVNYQNSVCDAGCGVGSLALPMAQMYNTVSASDISSSMTNEASARAQKDKILNVDFSVADMETLSGAYNTVTCIDVMIHYPTDKMYGIVQKLGAIATDRVILSFAPKSFYYSTLKKVGDFFPGKSKATRAYLHPEEDVVKALKEAGFKVARSEMTSTSFYYSRLLEAVRI